MGTLSLPASGIVYVDTSPVIYSVEENATYSQLLEPLWNELAAGQIIVVSSELILLETLVVPLRNNDSDLIAAYEGILTQSDLDLFPITAQILRDAAQLRATTKLKTPDAIHAATALSAQCTLFLTNDFAFQRIANLPVLVLDDVLNS
jgi:predicted nucleic acid-binding protein